MIYGSWRGSQGERQALETLIRQHQGWIFNLAVRMVWDPHEAEDVTQDVWCAP